MSHAIGLDSCGPYLGLSQTGGRHVTVCVAFRVAAIVERRHSPLGWDGDKVLGVGMFLARLGSEGAGRGIQSLLVDFRVVISHCNNIMRMKHQVEETDQCAEKGNSWEHNLSGLYSHRTLNHNGFEMGQSGARGKSADSKDPLWEGRHERIGCPFREGRHEGNREPCGRRSPSGSATYSVPRSRSRPAPVCAHRYNRPRYPVSG